MNSVATVAASLPILTFDEARLRPSFGYVFDPKSLAPFDSLVSMLWKFAWINRLAGHLIVQQIARRPVDPYEGVAATSDEIDVRHVARTLGVSLTMINAGIEQATRRRRWSPLLRFCPRCMALGYHSAVHQFSGEALCPIHGCATESACRRCSASSSYRIDASLMGAPFRCAQCRSHYSRSGHMCRRPLPKEARTAITRAFYGLDHKPLPVRIRRVR